MSIFYCRKCGGWFDTKQQLKYHQCGVAKTTSPAKQVAEAMEKDWQETQEKPVEEIEVITEVVDLGDNTIETEAEESETDTYPDVPLEDVSRKDMIKYLKSVGVDGRSLTKKVDDEKIKELYLEKLGKE